MAQLVVEVVEARDQMSTHGVVESGVGQPDGTCTLHGLGFQHVTFELDGMVAHAQFGAYCRGLVCGAHSVLSVRRRLTMFGFSNVPMF